MRSIFNAEDRQRLRRRLEMLTPATPARWGRMDAPRMICHLIDSLASSEAAARDPQEAWPDSEVFGRMSGHEWGALLWTHLNHHLKQFGV